MRLDYCVDELENTEWGTLQWECQEDERAAVKIRELCQRYIDAYDYLHGEKPDE